MLYTGPDVAAVVVDAAAAVVATAVVVVIFAELGVTVVVVDVENTVVMLKASVVVVVLKTSVVVVVGDGDLSASGHAHRILCLWPFPRPLRPQLPLSRGHWQNKDWASTSALLLDVGVEKCRLGEWMPGAPAPAEAGRSANTTVALTADGWDADPLCLGGANWSSCRTGQMGVMCQACKENWYRMSSGLRMEDDRMLLSLFRRSWALFCPWAEDEACTQSNRLSTENLSYKLRAI